MSVRVPGAVSDVTTIQNAAAATGAGDALPVNGHSGVVFDVIISDTATVTFQQTTDGTNYRSIEVVNTATGAKSTTATATGTFVAPIIGYQKVRGNITAFTAGTVTVVARAVPNAGGFSTADVDASGATITGTFTAGAEKAEDAAHSTGATGNYVLAVRADTAASTATTDGDYTSFITDATGRTWVNTEMPDAAALADSTANPTTPLVGAAVEYFNGSTWDRGRNNTDLTILVSAARTATVQSADFTNYNGKGLHLVIDVTSVTATPSVVFTIQGKDVLSGKYYTILASTAITATGTTVLKVYPGLTAAVNAAAADILPRIWRVDATHADADSITYSVGASVIL